jgi:LemA protein
VKTQFILERLYRVPRVTRRERFERRLRRLQKSVGRWLSSQSWSLALGAVGVVLLSSAHSFYYNMLLKMENNVLFTWSKVEAGQQKRNHVARNLTGLLRYYTHYETEILTNVTKLRTHPAPPEPTPAQAPPSVPGKLPSGPDGADLGRLVGRLNMVAEQYPLLHLQDTVQQFMTSVVNSESEIAGYIIGYNESVTMYGTALHTFPARIFGKVLGFKDYPLYKPEQPSVLEFRELKP